MTLAIQHYFYEASLPHRAHCLLLSTTQRARSVATSAWLFFPIQPSWTATSTGLLGLNGYL